MTLINYISPFEYIVQAIMNDYWDCYVYGLGVLYGLDVWNGYRTRRPV